MTEQQKIYRVLQLITRLKSGHFRVNTLSKQLEVSTKTIERYLKLLAKVGFRVEEDGNKRFFISEPHADQIAHHFEPLEIELLQQSLLALPDTQPLKQALLHKILLQSNLMPLAQALTNVTIGKITSQLNEAMLKKQVILRGYASSDGSVKDLLVEPLAFTNSFQISVFDVARDKIITPALDRIGSVEILDIPQTYKDDTAELDIFGFSEMLPQMVHIELSHRAYVLMLREYPLSKPFLYQNKEGVWHFKGNVFSYIGIGRFCLSLIGQLKVLENEGLRAFLNEKIANQQF